MLLRPPLPLLQWHWQCRRPRYRAPGATLHLCHTCRMLLLLSYLLPLFLLLAYLHVFPSCTRSVVENYSSSHAGGILAWGCSFFVSNSRIENVSCCVNNMAAVVVIECQW